MHQSNDVDSNKRENMEDKIGKSAMAAVVTTADEFAMGVASVLAIIPTCLSVPPVEGLKPIIQTRC
jgi:hypothetical protein